MAELKIDISKAVDDVIEQLKSKGYTPVKRGKWEKDKCSECKKSLEDIFTGDFYYDYDKVHYCPNCGADMRGDENG